MAAFILLHGFAQTPRSWDTVVAALQVAGHRTYALDLYRRSDSSLGQLCAYVSEVVRKVTQAEGAPVLVGYSMGGRIAAETLVRNPGLPLAALVLESAGLGPADETTRAAAAGRGAEWAARLRREGVASFMDWWETLPLFASQRALSAETRATVRAEREAHGAGELAHSLEAWGAQHQAAETDTLAALRALGERGVPVHYLAGASDEKYTALAERVRQAGLPVTLVPQAGHNVHLEQPVTFLRVVEPLSKR